MLGYLSPRRKISMSVDLNFNQRKALETLVSKGGSMPLLLLGLSRGDCTYLQNNNLIKIPAISKGRWVEISEPGLQALGLQEITEASKAAVVPVSVAEAKEAFLQAIMTPQPPSQGWTAGDVATVSSQPQMSVPVRREPSAKPSDLPAPGYGVSLSSVPREVLDFNDPLLR
jgi:hypothetical protein